MVIDSIEPTLGNIIVVKYEGSRSKINNSYHGKGTATMDNGNIFKGLFQNGLFHGKGKFTWFDGTVYEGEFKLGEIIGKGIYKWPDGSNYTGEVMNGLREGKGKCLSSSGRLYEGDWKKGKRTGSGKQYYSADKNSFYEGNWLNDQRNGFGLIKYPSGNLYEGEWVCDKKNGLGVMKWFDLDEKYLGNWYQDQPHGYGEHTWGDTSLKTAKKQMSNIYRGYFESGKKHGLGTFFYMNGSQYSGYWKADQKDGYGVFVQSDGKVQTSSFESNRMQTLAVLSLINNQSNSMPPRATEDVNPQYALYIDDILSTFPTTITKYGLSNMNSSEEIKSAPRRTADMSFSPLSPNAIILSFPTAIEETKEIERLLLRYNASLRFLYKKYCDWVNMKRNSYPNDSILDTGLEKLYADRLNPVLKTIFAARNLQNKLFCLSVEGFLRFMREIELVGVMLRSYDIRRLVLSMKESHDEMVQDSLYQYQCDQIAASFYSSSPSNTNDWNVPSTHTTTAGVKIDTTLPTKESGGRSKSPSKAKLSKSKSNAPTPSSILSTTLSNALDNEETKKLYDSEVLKIQRSIVNLCIETIYPKDSFEPRCTSELNNDYELSITHPLREYEFMDCFVRSVGMAYGRRGASDLSGMTLYHAVSEVLAEKVLPLANEYDIKVSPFYAAFYDPMVQDLLENGSKKKTNALMESGCFGHELVFVWMKMKSRSNLNPLTSSVDPVADPVADPRVGYIEVHHLVELMITLSNPNHGVIDPSVTPFQLISIMNYFKYKSPTTKSALSSNSKTATNLRRIIQDSNPSPPKKAFEDSSIVEVDTTTSYLKIDYYDFLELFCRIIVSMVWIYPTENKEQIPDSEPALDTEMEDGLEEKKGETGVILEDEINMTADLIQRLSYWLTSFPFENIE